MSPTPDPFAGWNRRRFLGGAAAAGAAAFLAGCGLNHGSSVDRPVGSGDGFGGELLDPPWDKPDITFTDLDGNPYPLREKTAGQLTMLFFGYTNCPDICPIYMQTLASAREIIGTGPGSRPTVLFVGADLERDTPEVLREYLGNIDPTFIGLTGSPEVIAEGAAAVMGAIQIGEPLPGGGYEVGHPAWVTVYSPDDDLAHRRYPYGVRQQDFVKDLPRLAQGEWA